MCRIHQTGQRLTDTQVQYIVSQTDWRWSSRSQNCKSKGYQQIYPSIRNWSIDGVHSCSQKLS